MLAAQNEARVAAQGQIFPEHMVLGLLTDPDAFAAKAIVTQGVTLEAARRAVARPTSPSPRPPCSMSASRNDPSG